MPASQPWSAFDSFLRRSPTYRRLLLERGLIVEKYDCPGPDVPHPESIASRSQAPCRTLSLEKLVDFLGDRLS